MSEGQGAGLTCYCGLYCGACAIKNGQIRDTASSLQDMLNTYQYGEWVPMVAEYFPVVKGWREFEGVMGWLMTQDCPACLGGGGNPDCAIRICAKEKGLAGCWACDDDPCDKVAAIDEGYTGAAKNRQRIREVGLDAWLAEQKALVESGFSYLSERSPQK